MNASADAAPSSNSHLRTLISALLIIVALILAPVAAIGTWTRVQLVDSDRFVATFAPLADDPAVQNFIADQVTDQIDEQVDFQKIIGEVFDGIAEANLPPRAAAAVAALEAPAVAGIQSLVATTTQRIVASDQFATLWETSLRVSHRQLTALMRDQPDEALALSNDGTLRLQLDPLVDAVKERLKDRGLTFVDRIDVKNRSIAIVHADSLGLAKLSYRVAVIGGLWLPWLVAALLIAGVLVANRRRRAMVISAVFFAIVFALMTAGIWIGGTAFELAVSPDPLPSAVATSVFDQVTAMMDSTLRALAFLGVLIAVVGWFAGPARPATATRAVLDSGFTSLRGALDRNGGDTRNFGRFLDRNRTVLLSVAVVLGIVALMMSRPVTFSAIAWLVVVLVVLAVAVEILRRPETGGTEPAPSAGDSDGDDGGDSANDAENDRAPLVEEVVE